MINFKILVAGDVHTGKTTLIQHISDFEPVSIDAIPSTDVELKLKNGLPTTIGFDYGAITEDDYATLHIFATPGQERFDFMWELLSKNSLGAIILVDATNEVSILHTPGLIKFYEDMGLPVVIAVSKLDFPDAKPWAHIVSQLTHLDYLILPVNLLDKKEVEILLFTLINLVLETNKNIIAS